MTKLTTTQLISHLTQTPAKYTPLVIIDPTGKQKSDFLKAIISKTCWQIFKAEAIANDLVEHLASNSLPEWRKAMLSKPALVIDTFDFIKGREATQREIYTLLNDYQNPVVLAVCDLDGFSEDILRYISESTIVYPISDNELVLGTLSEVSKVEIVSDGKWII